jgi:ribosome biogenesis GTPase
VTTGLQRAVIVAVGRNSAWAVLDGESQPRLAALRRLRGKRSMPVPGDAAWVRLLEDGTSVVDRLEPRVFSLARRTTGGRSKIMAANVDALVTVTSLSRPAPRLVTLDQLLAFAALERLHPVVVFTKPDLAPAGEREALEELYRGVGYSVVTMNPKSRQNLADFREATFGRRAMMCGISGVGKSTIFAALGGEGPVGTTSRHGVGRQTTTVARLIRMGDGFLIDSPGVNEFGLGAITPPELAYGFPEMRGPSGACRFTDCTHVHEPGCGVLAALAAGQIAESRYASYKKILLEPA